MNSHLLEEKCCSVCVFCVNGFSSKCFANTKIPKNEEKPRKMSSKVPSDNMSEQMRSYITDQLFFSSGAVSLTNEELQNMAFGPINLTNMRQFDQSRPNSSERASGSSRHSVETNDSPVLESSIVSNDEIEKAIAIETLEYSPRKAVKNGKNKVQEHCVFCRNNNEPEEVYKSHPTRDVFNRTICPKLRAYVCPTCGVSGDFAHTMKYCPQKKIVTRKDIEARGRRPSSFR